MITCPECGAGADLTPDGTYAHCASCNNIFQPGKEGSGEKGAGSGSGDQEKSQKKEDEKKEKQDKGAPTKRKEWSSGIQAQEWKGS